MSQTDENAVFYARGLWAAKNKFNKMWFIYEKLGNSIMQSGDKGKLTPYQEFFLAFFFKKPKLFTCVGYIQYMKSELILSKVVICSITTYTLENPSNSQISLQPGLRRRTP